MPLFNGSVNSKHAHPHPLPLGICRAFVILPVPRVGNLTENLCPGVGKLSILLEAVKIVPFSIFELKNYGYLDSYRIKNIFNTYAMKRHGWF